jgi:4-carboxymuconolactone decarboxylase
MPAKAAKTVAKPAAKPVAKIGPNTRRKELQGPAFEKGLAMRRAVLGAEYVDASIARADDFMVDFQKMVTEYCWGEVWTRPGLSRRDRSLLNLAMLTALNRPNELRLHLRGAVNNGVTTAEIKEILLQTGIYCGIPACLDAFKVASEVLKEMGKL